MPVPKWENRFRPGCREKVQRSFLLVHWNTHWLTDRYSNCGRLFQRSVILYKYRRIHRSRDGGGPSYVAQVLFELFPIHDLGSWKILSVILTGSTMRRSATNTFHSTSSFENIHQNVVINESWIEPTFDIFPFVFLQPFKFCIQRMSNTCRELIRIGTLSQVISETLLHIDTRRSLYGKWA